MKKFTTLCLGTLLSAATLFGADFSKTSLQELQNMAGKVPPKDVLDYRIEINKRLDSMTVKEAREFKKSIHENAKANQSKMSEDALQKYRAEVKAETRKQLDNMNYKEAREKGLLGFGHHKHRMHPKKGEPKK